MSLSKAQPRCLFEYMSSVNLDPAIGTATSKGVR